MPKRLLQAVILTLLIKLLAVTSSPNFSGVTSTRVSNASKTSIALLYHWFDSMSDEPNGRLRQRSIQQVDNQID